MSDMQNTWTCAHSKGDSILLCASSLIRIRQKEKIPAVEKIASVNQPLIHTDSSRETNFVNIMDIIV
jgi:hypothetical protein